MHSGGDLGGWEGVLGDDADETDEATTDPNLPRPEPGSRTAMPKPTEERSTSAPRKLKLPVPGKSSSAPLTDDLGAPSPGRAPLASRSKEAPEPEPPRSFSSAELVEKLDVAPKKEASSTWRDYKDVIRTALLGAIVLGGIIGYRVYASMKEEALAEAAAQAEMAKAEATAKKAAADAIAAAEAIHKAVEKRQTPAAPVETASPPSAATNTAQQPTPQQTQPQPPQQTQPSPEQPVHTVKAAIPMVTIVSSPIGALVEINGMVYGKTPLIMPSPQRVTSMRVKLKYDKYQTWDEVVNANSAGHFTVNATLKALR
jgi:hypothetical protein